MDDATRRDLFSSGRSATLGTITTEGRPHLVPCCYAASTSAEEVFTAVDGKPKSTMALRRLANIEASPSVSFLLDHFDEDWSTLWWIRVDGRATVVESGPQWERSIDLLVEKYPQYQQTRPEGAVISVEVTGWRSWSAS